MPSILPFKRAFQQPYLVRRQIEQLVDDGVDFTFGGFNLLCQLDYLGGFLREIFFPTVPVLDPNFGLKGLLHLSTEEVKIERPEILKVSALLLAPRWRQIRKDAVIEGGLDYETFTRCFAALFTKSGQLSAVSFGQVGPWEWANMLCRCLAKSSTLHDRGTDKTEPNRF